MPADALAPGKTLPPRSRKALLELELNSEKEKLAATVSELRTRAQETGDIQSHLRNHPLATVGAAVVVGALFGMLSKPRRKSHRVPDERRQTVVEPPPSHQQAPSTVRTIARSSANALGTLAAQRAATVAGKLMTEWSNTFVDMLRDRYSRPTLERSSGFANGREHDAP